VKKNLLDLFKLKIMTHDVPLLMGENVLGGQKRLDKALVL